MGGAFEVDGVEGLGDLVYLVGELLGENVSLRCLNGRLYLFTEVVVREEEFLIVRKDSVARW